MYELMDSFEFKKEIESVLLSMDKAHHTDKDQIAMRCFFCGDSKKDASKTRLYFKLNANNDGPILYNCFNCNASGMLTPSTLKSMGVYDLQLSSSLTKHNKIATKAHKKSLGNITKKIKNIVIPSPANTEANIQKLKYIRERLGVKFSIKELLEYRVIFNMSQFLEVNKLDPLIEDWKIKGLDRDYIGFLSVNKDRVIFRDVTNKNKLRYIKHPLVPQLDNSDKMYALPGSIGLMSKNPININFAEGTFDILGVYNHIFNKDTTNNLYMAILDAAYPVALKYFLSRGVLGSNVTINIFSDQDKSPYYYSELAEHFKPWVKTINLYYNELSKDFGVPKEEISLIRRRIPKYYGGQS